MQLLLDVAPHPGLRDAPDVARLGAEREPVQHVRRLLLGGEGGAGCGRYGAHDERGQQHADGDDGK